MTDQQKGGLLGKILLPGYADAGANTSFHQSDLTINSITLRTMNDEDVETEIHDNLTSQRSQYHVLQHQNENHRENLTKNSNHSSGGNHATLGESDSGKHHGFFPTTNPGVSRQHSHYEASSSSPCPKSPPIVARRQLPTPSVAGTSVIPETGARIPPSLESLRAVPSGEQQSDIASSAVVGQHFLGDNDEQEDLILSSRSIENEDPREQRQEGEDACDEESMDTFPSSFNFQNRNSILMERDSDLISEANSTASEMGTVINLNGARMAEIDAMAALIEASPMGYHESSTEEPSMSDELALPVLESCPPSRNQDGTPTLRFPANKQAMSLRDLGIEGKSSTGSASATVSAAIRRIGSGIHKIKLHSESHSAPPTPRTPGVQLVPRVEDLLKSTLTPQPENRSHPPASFALRSPGSAARQSLFESPGVLTPRYSRQPRLTLSSSSRTPLVYQNTSPTNTIKTPLCYSTMTPSSNTKTPLVYNGAAPSSNTKTPIVNNSKPPQSPNVVPGPFRFAQRCFSFDSTLDELHTTNDDQVSAFHRPGIRSSSRCQPSLVHSQSWDPSRPSRIRESRSHQGQPFRSPPNNRFHPAFRATQEDDNRRSRLHDDFSPSKASSQELQTPHRIEIEREDALDILACLVERGVSLHEDASKGDSKAGLGLKGIHAIQEEKETSDFNSDYIGTVCEELRIMSEEQEKSGRGRNSHTLRMSALEELLRSHSYAMEMKRATLSASVWLKSIGRSGMSVPDGGRDSDSMGGQASGEGNGIESKDKIEMMTLKALLHTAQIEAKERAAAVERLNEELSKCRAEIGRLKTASRGQVSTIGYAFIFWDLFLNSFDFCYRA